MIIRREFLQCNRLHFHAAENVNGFKAMISPRYASILESQLIWASMRAEMSAKQLPIGLNAMWSNGKKKILSVFAELQEAIKLKILSRLRFRARLLIFVRTICGLGYPKMEVADSLFTTKMCIFWMLVMAMV